MMLPLLEKMGVYLVDRIRVIDIWPNVFWPNDLVSIKMYMQVGSCATG
jgi:hypothetical protein